ncbi:sugar phosphorylase [Mesorhizobium sp. M0092]|uniref:sugar phosphorylase n=1 Tax=Mesorhizobium sp. M0092 TaxID=2956876 RepID=UPI00333D7F1A
MKLRELLDRVKDLPPDTLVCVAEIDEAFGVNVAVVESIDDAKIKGRKPEGTEAVELGNGTEKVVVIRW